MMVSLSGGLSLTFLYIKLTPLNRMCQRDFIVKGRSMLETIQKFLIAQDILFWPPFPPPPYLKKKKKKN